MKRVRIALLPSILLALPLIASANPWKDESEHGRDRGHGRHEHKEEYWDGNCKVERKYGRDGENKEERKGRGPRHEHYDPAPVYVSAPPPVY